jgi:(4S)-4-hydroxy-5-phosphonooxypentane-2,3-dione isomerase
MSQVALFVEFDLKPEHFDEFEKIIRSHGRRTKEGEEGCMAFEVLIPRDEPNRLYLYECYRDAAAFDVHVNSPLLQETRASYEGMYNDRTLHICDQE